jgi:hypothetical protein
MGRDSQEAEVTAEEEAAGRKHQGSRKKHRRKKAQGAAEKKLPGGISTEAKRMGRNEKKAKRPRQRSQGEADERQG